MIFSLKTVREIFHTVPHGKGLGVCLQSVCDVCEAFSARRSDRRARIAQAGGNDKITLMNMLAALQW